MPCLSELGLNDLDSVGGKNASLGEMIKNLTQSGVCVPGGFATKAQAFDDFIKYNDLQTKISDELAKYDQSDINGLSTIGSKIRNWIINSPFQPEFEQHIRSHYQELIDSLGEQATFRSAFFSYSRRYA